MSLIQPLPPGPLDIVGDIHGELPALRTLMHHLGYDEQGRHREGRRLIFVGDLVDRGSDSPGTVALVRQLIQTDRARAVLGNHEINLLRRDPKDGAGWFFDERLQRDHSKYPAFARPRDDDERHAILHFLRKLPLGLEREDLRIVHAAWLPDAIARARQIPLGQTCIAYDDWEIKAACAAHLTHIAERMALECQHWPHSLEDEHRRPPFLTAHCDSELNKAAFNPLKILTCGLVRQATRTFFAGNKWRFVERVAWWQEYAQNVPVIIGHYWRRADPTPASTPEDLFGNIPPFSWHGLLGNVFCMDYSVGARPQARKFGAQQSPFRLGAMRWPERELVFDDGLRQPTQGFMQPQPDTTDTTAAAATSPS